MKDTCLIDIDQLSEAEKSVNGIEDDHYFEELTVYETWDCGDGYFQLQTTDDRSYFIYNPDNLPIPTGLNYHFEDNVIRRYYVTNEHGLPDYSGWSRGFVLNDRGNDYIYYYRTPLEDLEYRRSVANNY